MSEWFITFYCCIVPPCYVHTTCSLSILLVANMWFASKSKLPQTVLESMCSYMPLCGLARVSLCTVNQ